MSLKHGPNFEILGFPLQTKPLSTFVVALSLTLLWGAVGCEKKSSAPPPPPPGGEKADAPPEASKAGGPKTKLVPGAVENPGTVKGVVKFEGSVPPLGKYPMASKPECAGLHGAGAPAQELILVGENQGLRDVFVQVTKGLESYTFDPPAEPAAIDQKGCVYTPHVFGVMTGQDLKLINSDPFLHNVKVLQNRPLNEAMPNVGETIKKKWFKKVGVPTTFQCEVHPFMKAYACVVDHPYYSVTGQDGAFEIKGLPPGTYTISVWHEVFPGLKAVSADQEVTVGGGETKELEFAYKIGG